jgi:hypothetical protein
MPLSDGVVMLLEGADAAAIEQALSPLGLQGTRIEQCDKGAVVVWVPAVDTASARLLENVLRERLPSATIRESEVIAPTPASGPR